MDTYKLEQVLEKYVPKGLSKACALLIIENKIHLTISKERSSKLGDYRHPFEGKGHRISVNHNLNPYSFFITFIHEIAHLHTYNAFKNKVQAHGAEWKLAFRKLMVPYLNSQIFPKNVLLALENYIKNPAASSCADINLMAALQEYNVINDDLINLSSLAIGSKFELNGRVFIKGESKRTRVKCQDLNNLRFYMVHEMARVKLI